MTDTPISLDALRDRDHRERGDLVPLPSWFRVVTEDELGALVEAVSAAKAYAPISSPFTADGLPERRRLHAALSRFVSEQTPNGKNEKPVADETSARSGDDS